ncbi:hypothetical protein [Goodfellowiella coeruleoviolacea]|uniref:Uncharacterized protein n=1 Tax=Goodfellowiella coeruleoviolacea TaxID=334858 RepID=A0AAE3KJ90_9PSEU|nr:hypothetical protein [Goodfellowiella coeruleoviolacea]MCP2169355.1 hypothetical protein [Goodfellowiella coeruleoviolacea]
MPKWQQLSPAEQQQKLVDITSRVVATLPQGWQRFVLRTAVIGSHSEMSTGIRMPDGTIRNWAFPAEVWRMFQQLRKGMYIEGIGTWIEFEYVVTPPAHFSIRFNHENEPGFTAPPTEQNFATEFRWFPRTDGNMPAWFRRGLNGTTPTT